MSETIHKILKSISSDVLDGRNYNSRELGRKILNYPAMMVPSVQDSIIKSLVSSYDGEISMIDPFMGASNSLITGMKYGVNIFGQDINPLAILISQVKTNIYNDSLKQSFELLLTRLNRSRSTTVDVKFNNIDKWFQKDVQIELSQIRRLILREEDLFTRKFFWVALGEVIRITSNDRTSTFKMHVRTEEDILNRKLSPKSSFIKICERSIEDLLNIRDELKNSNLLSECEGKYKGKISIQWGDSKKGIITEDKFDLLVTSPPYGDNPTTVTYGQFSYLPLQWIPLKDIDNSIDMDYLSKIVKIDSESLGGRIVQKYEEVEAKMFGLSKSLKAYFQGLSIEQKVKAKKVVSFFYDLNITINNVNQKMKPGAFLVWTIGNRYVNNKEVTNDLILIELLSHSNIKLLTDLERDILSKRMPGKNNFSQTMSKEKILIFQKDKL